MANKTTCERCDKNSLKRTVYWIKAWTQQYDWDGDNTGPENDGYCMQVGNTDPGGDSIYENINYCPWCGRKLDGSQDVV